MRAWVRAVLIAAAALAAAAGPTHAQPIGSTGGAFELVDHTGERFSSATLAGRPYAIFFGFTHCPDVCPTTLLMVSNALAALGADADRLKVLFVSVDAERDTPEQLRAYLESFDPRIIGLTGSDAEIATAAKGFNAFYNKLPESDGSFTIVHSAYVYLVDRNNRLVDALGFQEEESQQLAKLKKLLE